MIIIFDGVCNLCEASVLFIIRRDPAGIFRFAPTQSEAGQRLQAEYGIYSLERASVVLIQGDQVLLKSDAALEIARHLTGPWRYLYPLRRLPRGVRNGVYDFIARNRYRWFGQKDECMIPTPALRARFLG